MIKNMGNLDRVIRLVVAAAIVALYFTDVIPGTLGIVFMIIAGIFALTSFISFCPIYAPFKFNTCPKPEKK